MRRCACGQSVSLLSLFDLCETCLRDYLSQLSSRSDFSVVEFQRERRSSRKFLATHTPIEPHRQRVRLLDTAIDPVTLEQTIQQIEAYVESGQPHQLVTVNVDFVKIAQENERFRQIINSADLSVADGKPLLWAARWTGQELPARITGMDLVLGVAELAARRSETMFLLGAAEGVAAKAADVLRARYPGLSVQFYSPPMGPFSDAENARMVELIRASGATYLFVAFGAPKQDVWINEHLHELDVPVCAGIGGVLNFLAGVVKRAPGWVQRSGFEWLYLILQEPTRLWRRYFLEDLPVFVRMLREPVAGPVGTSALGVPSVPALALMPIEYEQVASSFRPMEQVTGGS
jgi:N-acetylglucosaminyldiphosphoundecaprenol N-acetyl-beta-D-mannosaminyltransferase